MVATTKAALTDGGKTLIDINVGGKTKTLVSDKEDADALLRLLD